MKHRRSLLSILFVVLCSLGSVQAANAFTDPVATSFPLSPATAATWPIQLIASQADGHGLTYAVTGGPSHGSVVMLDAGRGMLTYTSVALYTGTDTFTFTATDNTTSAVSNTATVTLTVVNQHTSIAGHLINPNDTPRQGSVIWEIMTTGITNDGALVPAGSRVTATLDVNGNYTASLFATTTLSPVCYYTLTFQSTGGQTTKIGTYSIPVSSATLTQAALDANRVTNTNTASYFSPMSESTGQALIKSSTDAVAAAEAAQAAAESASSTSHIYDIPANPISGFTTPNQKLLVFVSDRTFTLNVTGSTCVSEVAAAGQTDFGVYVGTATSNGSLKGTLRFAASGTTCSVVSPVTTTVNSGDVVRIIGPATPDTALSNLGFNLRNITSDLNMYDLAGFVPGVMTPSQKVLRFPAARAFTLSLTGSTCIAEIAPVAQTDLGVYVGTATSNGTQVGTLRFAAAGHTCSLATGTSTPISIGQVIRVIGPVTPDTLANTAFTLKGAVP